MRRFRRLTARVADCKSGLESLDPTDPNQAGCASRVLALSAACASQDECFVCVAALPAPFPRSLSWLAADGGRTMRRSSASSKMRSIHGSASIRWMRMFCESALQETNSVPACASLLDGRFGAQCICMCGGFCLHSVWLTIRLAAARMGQQDTRSCHRCGWRNRICFCWICAASGNGDDRAAFRARTT